jgi:hypothetical protein
LDNGADDNIVSEDTVRTLMRAGNVRERRLPVPVSVGVADGRFVMADRRVTLDVSLATTAGPVPLKGAKFLVIPGSTKRILIGRDDLRTLGLPDLGAALTAKARDLLMPRSGDNT